MTDLSPCPFCGKPPGTKVGPPALARCVTDGCEGKNLAASTITEWNAGAPQSPAEPIAWLDMRSEPATDWMDRIVATNPDFVERNGPQNFVPLYAAPQPLSVAQALGHSDLLRKLLRLDWASDPGLATLRAEVEVALSSPAQAKPEPSEDDYDPAHQAPAPSTWQDISTAPIDPLRDPPLVMLWVSDGGHMGKGTHAFGRCYRSHDGTIRGVASGFSGNWEIKYWKPLGEGPEVPSTHCGSGK